MTADTPVLSVEGLRKYFPIRRGVLRRVVASGRSVIAVHHDLATVPSYFDQVLLLNGRAVAAGNVKAAFTPEAIARAYGGRLNVLEQAVAEGEGEGWTTLVEPRTAWLDWRIAELWGSRDLISMLVWRDFVAYYKQTVLGPLWHVIQPLLELRDGGYLRSARRLLRQAPHPQAHDDGDKRQCVHREAPALAERPDQEAADHRARAQRKTAEELFSNFLNVLKIPRKSRT